MPKKISELRKALLKAGFTESPGKGSHRTFSNDQIAGIKPWTLSGKLSDDAKPYQEKAVKKLVQDSEFNKKQKG